MTDYDFTESDEPELGDEDGDDDDDELLFAGTEDDDELALDEDF